MFLNKRYSYISNIINPTFIDGNDVEIFNYKILKLINNKAKSKFDKEHVTTFLRRNLNGTSVKILDQIKTYQKNIDIL